MSKVSVSCFKLIVITFSSIRYENVIIFIIGGITLEESAYVNSINEKRLANPGMPRVLLASTCLHNTKSFIEQLVQLTPEYSNVSSFASVA